MNRLKFLNINVILLRRKFLAQIFEIKLFNIHTYDKSFTNTQNLYQWIKGFVWNSYLNIHRLGRTLP